MPRAYLRLDPALPDHKADYPDGAFRAFVEILCLAEQQPRRGYFKSHKLLRVLLERRARWIQFLFTMGDLVLQDDGSLYVDGWREWQEGDVTVPERMQRLRARRARRAVTDDTAAVTVPATPGVTNVAVTQPSSGGGGGKQSGERRAVTRATNGSPLPEPDPRPVDDPNDEALVADLRRWARSSDRQIAKHNLERLERMGLEP